MVSVAPPPRSWQTLTEARVNPAGRLLVRIWSVTGNGAPKVVPWATSSEDHSPTGATWEQAVPLLPGPSEIATPMPVAGGMINVDWMLVPLRVWLVEIGDVSRVNPPLKFGSLFRMVLAVPRRASPWLVPPSLKLTPEVLASNVTTNGDAPLVVYATVTVTDVPERRAPRSQRSWPVLAQLPAEVVTETGVSGRLSVSASLEMLLLPALVMTTR